MSSDQWVPEAVGDPINYYSQTLTSSYTPTTQDMVLLCDCTSGAITVTLPQCSLVAGKELIIKKIDSSSNAVTIATTNSETIDGVTTQTVGSQYQSLTLMNNSTSWYIL